MPFPQDPGLIHCSGWVAFIYWKAIQYFAFSMCLTCGLNPYLPQTGRSWSEERFFNLIWEVSHGLNDCSLLAVHKCVFIFRLPLWLSSPFYSWKTEEQRGAVISGTQFKTPGPNLSGYLPLCNSSDIQSRAPIESCCSCECSALLQIRPWSFEVRYPYNWEHAIRDHVCKMWCKNLLMSYKRDVAQARRGASSSSDWLSIALCKIAIAVFPNSSTVFKAHHSTCNRWIGS